MEMLPKDTETSKTSCSNEILMDATAIVDSDPLMDGLDHQTSAEADDTPKLDQFLLDSIAAAVTSSSTLVTSTIGFQNFGGNGGAGQSSQQTIDTPEMPQLMSILNELLDGQDLTSLANTGGNGVNMQDMVDQEENYEDDSPRKDDPEELTRLLVQQRLEKISRDQQQLHRKMEFLTRRLYKLVGRATGLHASEEIAGFLEHAARHHKKSEKELKKQQTSTTIDLTSLLTRELPLDLLSSPSASSEQKETQNAASDELETRLAEPIKPVPLSEMKTFLTRIESVSKLQNTTLNKRAHSSKYFTKPSPNSLNTLTKSETNLMNSSIVRFEDEDIEQLGQVFGILKNKMRLIENQIDSDATASSSGGDSADEMVAYNNYYQQPLSISKRAAYKYAKDRGAVASRWCWLATQISELDYKIRQHTDLRKHIKDNKGAVTLEEVIGSQESDETAARIRPFAKLSFRKRKLVQTANLHQVSKKAGRPSTLKCGCQFPLQPCALCTGRVDPTAPRDLTFDTLPTAERVALLDPGFHPVLSFADDVSNNIHLEAIMNIPEWQAKMIRSSPKSIMKHANKQLELLGVLNDENGNIKETAKAHLPSDEKKVRKGNIDLLTGKRKYTKKLLKFDGVLSNKLKERKKHKQRAGNLAFGGANPHVPRKYTFKKRIRKMNSDGISLHNYHPNEKHFEPINRSKNSSPVPHHRAEKKYSESRSRNYDVDNIVIPYSVAAATRVELLSYKEIPTPKWRVITEEDEREQLTVEQEQCNQSGEHPEDEDISDECLVVKHDKALLEERKKFATYLKFPLTSRSRANRRIDSRGNESSGTNTPTLNPTSPAPGMLTVDLDTVPELPESPTITALLNSFNGRKERHRTHSKKEDDGIASGTISRCSSPEASREAIPAYEPLTFPLNEISLQKMKRIMPTSVRSGERQTASQQATMSQRPRLQKKRKHNDSISESKLIKEKLPSSSLSTIGKNINILIPRNNHTILESIDLTETDGAVLKQLMNNNNDGVDDELENDDERNLGDSDSETVTGDESSFAPEDASESD